MEVNGSMSESGKILFLDRNAPCADNESNSASSAVPLTDEEAMRELCRILIDNRMDPVLQLSGYLVSEDPTYLPEGTEARAIARRIGRDGLLGLLIRSYISSIPDTPVEKG